MNELKSTAKLVKWLLQQEPQTRNSDSLLYLKVIQQIAKQKGIDLESITVCDFFASMKANGFPASETVRRTRQYVQARCPDLAACEEIEGLRDVREHGFRKFAKSAMVDG